MVIYVMDKICVFFVYGISGGTATLSYRLSREYQKRGFRIFYVCEEINDEDNYHLFKEQGIEIIVCKHSYWYRNIKDFIIEADKVVAWVYSFEIYFAAEKVKRARKNLETNIFLYVVHERCLIRGNGSGKGVYDQICSWINSLNALYIKTIDQNNELLFMEQRIIDLSEDYLKMRFQDTEDKVLPLPYLFTEQPFEVPKRKKIISTMTRIDFPFKKYVMGLIDIFCKYYKDYGLELWIIGTGKSEDELKEKIAQLDDEVKNKIKLFGNVEYIKVKEILRDTYVFVGMGTGLLDAASVMLPSIGVQAYKYECLGDGFLNENPSVLGYLSEQNGLHSIEKELLEILQLSKEEYSELCKKEYMAAKDYYSIENFIIKLYRLKKGNYRHSMLERIGYKVNYILGKVNLFLHQY